MLKVGESASLCKIISDHDIRLFADISGDRNPIHVDAAYAAGTNFGQRVAHGMLVAGMISALLGMQLPGPGSIYISQVLEFCKPVYVNDEITAIVEVLKIRKDKPIVNLSTVCINQRKQMVIKGEAIMAVPRQLLL